MGTIFNTAAQTPQTEKGNRLYEFKRISSDELQDYRIPTYSYIVWYENEFQITEAEQCLQWAKGA